MSNELIDDSIYLEQNTLFLKDIGFQNLILVQFNITDRYNVCCGSKYQLNLRNILSPGISLEFQAFLCPFQWTFVPER